ncbi:hypothetical protein JCGZ_09318 [Jatropha curcas]|uniref:BHLH domain-containing protein n=1 Tax=Jatropha curcas TaxID=180498 RepID=A0A067KRW3_JATCU|nr:hypothetical protein JCGZ_09318 [Jatropha curcas]
MPLWEIVEPYFRHNGGHVSMVTNDPSIIKPSSSFPTSISSNMIMYEKDYLQDPFAGFPDIPCCPYLHTTGHEEKYGFKPCDEQPCSGSKIKATEMDIPSEFSGEANKKKHDKKPKSARSAEMHKMYERKHRHQIKEKMKALQELVPYNLKGDKASVLDDAIAYIKALKMQNEALGFSMMGEGGTWQATAMSQTGSNGSVTPSGQYVSVSAGVSVPPPLHSSSADNIQFSPTVEEGQVFPVPQLPFITFPTSTSAAVPSFNNSFCPFSLPDQQHFGFSNSRKLRAPISQNS